MAISHSLTELTGITSPLLADESGLSALAIAAGGALGLTAHGPPQARAGAAGIAVGLLGHGGHVILHAVPAQGTVLVDIVTPGTTPATRAIEVIARRLGVELRSAE